MLPAEIDAVSIRGFRSLADVTLADLPDATVLIGANGSGKSNFLRFFEMLNWMVGIRRLGEFVQRQGGADDQLFGGSRTTSRLEAEVTVMTAVHGRADYKFALSHAHPDRFLFNEEAFRFNSQVRRNPDPWQHLDSGHTEAKIVEAAQSLPDSGVHLNPFIATPAYVITKFIPDCYAYQFHDTSDVSNIKQSWDATDRDRLLKHGGNLAAVLYRLEREDIRRYELICRHIRRILPGFDRFVVEENYGKVTLRWQAKWTDKTFGAHLTSDGSLRLFALVTLLNLPLAMLPSVILLDEPELGLHPAAVTLIGGMIRALSTQRQIIVATQSPLLVDAFGLDQIFVLDLREGRTEIRPLDPANYQKWMEDSFTPGELWQKNLLGGRP